MKAWAGRTMQPLHRSGPNLQCDEVSNNPAVLMNAGSRLDEYLTLRCGLAQRLERVGQLV
jgi:hypothetical protein